MKLLAFVVFGILVLLCVAPCAKARPLQPGDNLLTLSATGSSPTDADSFSLGGSFQLSHMLTKELEILISDSPTYTDVGGATWTNQVSVGAAFDFNGIVIGGHDFIPFVGGTVGFLSGAGDDTGTTGVFGGARYFVSDSAFVFGQIGFDWEWNGHNSENFPFSLGIGWRF